MIQSHKPQSGVPSDSPQRHRSPLARAVEVLSAAVLVLGCLVLAQVPLAAATNNLTGVVYLSGGTPAFGAGVSVGSANPGGCCQNATTDSGGNYGFALTDGTWNVNVNPPSGDTTDAQASLTVTVFGGVVTGCTGAACGGTLPAVNITLPKADVTGVVFDPDGITPAANSGLTASPSGGGSCCQNAFTDQNGNYAMALADGTWTVTAIPPASDTTDAQTPVTVTIDHGVATNCTGTACGGTIPVVNITLQKATLTGTVFESDGTTPAANTGLSAGNPNPGGCCQGTNTNQNGNYAFALTAGTWNVTANPPFGDSTDAQTSVTVTVDSGGVVTNCTGTACSGTLPAVNITLQKATLTGTVYQSNGTPAANTGVSAGNLGSCCQNANTNQSGNYGFALTAGTWNVTANPPNGDTTDAPTSVTVTVDSSGTVTGCTGAGCSGTLPAVNIKLQVASFNLAGSVLESDGITPAANSGLTASPSGGGFCCHNTSTDQFGNYAMSLAGGTWNVTANPPSGDSTDAPTSVTVTVNSSGVVTGCTGPCSGTLPTVNITLQKANLTGIVYQSNDTPGGQHRGLGGQLGRRVLLPEHRHQPDRQLRLRSFRRHLDRHRQPALR